MGILSIRHPIAVSPRRNPFGERPAELIQCPAEYPWRLHATYIVLSRRNSGARARGAKCPVDTMVLFSRSAAVSATIRHTQGPSSWRGLIDSTSLAALNTTPPLLN